MTSQSGIPWMCWKGIHSVPLHRTWVNSMLPEQLRRLVGDLTLWRKALYSIPHVSSKSWAGHAYFHPLLSFLILLVLGPLMVRRPLIRARQCQDTAEAGQYQGNAAESHVSTRVLQATPLRGLEKGAHREMPTALAEIQKGRFKEERARIEGIRVQRWTAQEEICWSLLLSPGCLLSYLYERQPWFENVVQLRIILLTDGMGLWESMIVLSLTTLALEPLWGFCSLSLLISRGGAVLDAPLSLNVSGTQKMVPYQVEGSWMVCLCVLCLVPWSSHQICLSPKLSGSDKNTTRHWMMHRWSTEI